MKIRKYFYVDVCITYIRVEICTLMNPNTCINMFVRMHGYLEVQPGVGTYTNTCIFQKYARSLRYPCRGSDAGIASQSQPDTG